MHHSAAAKFEPTGLTARAATISFAEDAVDVVFRRRFSEREIRGTQTRVNGAAKVRACECLERAGQIGKGNVAVDNKTFDLMEHRHV